MAQVIWPDALAWTQTQAADATTASAADAMISNGLDSTKAKAYFKYATAYPRVRLFQIYPNQVAQDVVISAFCFSPCFLALNGLEIGAPFNAALYFSYGTNFTSPLQYNQNTQDSISTFRLTMPAGANLIEIISHSYPEAGRFATSTNGVFTVSGVWLSASPASNTKTVLFRSDASSWKWSADTGPNFGYDGDSTWCARPVGILMAGILIRPCRHSYPRCMSLN